MECAIRLVIENSAWMLVAEAACGVSMAVNERTLNYFGPHWQNWMLYLDLSTWWGPKYRKPFFFFGPWWIETVLSYMFENYCTSANFAEVKLESCRTKHEPIIVIHTEWVINTMVCANIKSVAHGPNVFEQWIRFIIGSALKYTVERNLTGSYGCHFWRYQNTPVSKTDSRVIPVTSCQSSECFMLLYHNQQLKYQNIMQDCGWQHGAV